jgi:hypothetical protein
MLWIEDEDDLHDNSGWFAFERAAPAFGKERKERNNS